ncbi:DUF3560 domain-containing protein [Caproicibacter fermentans]|uniref:DUF3560 domain-containing protein n=1 Tax=Caproicibacter fermentans TaxID=2576756 RepID=A0A7G8TE13_9FIRM|nr:DUF3560 domain-containing protein [Caproicibacter fermentans]QNK41854.1 DUF3560 domain-containing protein [Caproicibacter fermentans]
MSGRADYEERRQARIDRLNGAARKATEESDRQYKRSHDLVKDIPFGQPNIEGRPALPRLREKSWNALGKAVEADEKAAYYAGRAEAAESNSTISSDDPEAIEKLKSKLADLEAERERVKASNKAARAAGKEPAPWYTLPYLGKDIKRIKDRIAHLERVDQMPAETIKFDGGEIISDADTNRVMVRHDEKPDSTVIQALKSNGFHWARSERAWVRLRNPNALYAAKAICGIK